MNRRQASWSNLPPELLTDIAGRLETRTDIRKFRAVCQNWRQSATFALLPHKNLLSPLLPHKITTPTPPLLNKNRSARADWEISGNSLIIVPSSVFLLKSSQNPELPPWLITIEELNPGKFYLRKPLSRINIKKLPENFPKILQLSDFKVTEMGRFCTLRLADRHWVMFKKKFWRYCTDKVVLFVDTKCKNTPTINDCTAVVLYDSGTLSAIRLENEEEKHLNPKGRKFDDIVNFNGKIYAVDRRGRVYRMSYYSLSMYEIVDEPLSDGSSTDKKKRLFVLLNELYLVYRCHQPRCDIDFEVYRLKEKEEEWEMVKDMGDGNILFVTYDGCFLGRTKDFPGWRGNSIVFYKNSFPQYQGASLDYNVFGKHYDDELDIGIFHFDDGCGIGSHGWPIASSRRYSDVFWPPPAWLLPVTNLSTSFCEEEDEVSEDEDEVSEEEDEEEQSDSLIQSAQRVETPPSPLQANIQHVSRDVASAKNTRNNVYKGKIPGVYVSPQFVPTLNKIWEKHGNIIQGHMMQDNNQLKWALESLANIVMLLQNASGMFLNDGQVAYLNATVHQLQCMHFRLDWLYPFIQKALAQHNWQKQRHFIKGLEMSKSNLLALLRDVESALAKHRQLVDESIVGAPLVELKNVLN